MVDDVLRSELLQRRERDQAVRTSVSHGNIEAVDVANTAFMKRVIAEHGWPGFDLAGEDGAHAAWLLVQHADRDPAFQQQCLPLLQDAVASGQASPADAAYLIDRVRVAEGRPQVYGTQYRQSAAGGEPHPIEDPERLDQLRAEVGLGPHADYDRQVRRLQT